MACLFYVSLVRLARTKILAAGELPKTLLTNNCRFLPIIGICVVAMLSYFSQIFWRSNTYIINEKMVVCIGSLLFDGKRLHFDQ